MSDEKEPIEAETTQSSDESLKEASQEALELHRAKRRGCIILIIISWLVLGGTIVIGMIFVRSNVNRNAEEIAQFMETRFELNLPDGFEPYSMNHFFGAHVITYWDMNNVREDGRTKNVLGIYREDDWHGKKLSSMEERLVGRLEGLLAKNEFGVESQQKEVIARDGERITIYCFIGKATLDDVVVDAVSCFRFMEDPEGPIQFQTLGPTELFPLEKQMATLAGIRVKK